MLARVATALNRHLVDTFHDKVPADLRDACQTSVKDLDVLRARPSTAKQEQPEDLTERDRDDP
jgi:hypothetical protein